MSSLNPVFLSYSSDDVEVAQRIAEALRSHGIEVWFDRSELRGGDAWDRQIRKQIHDCALFVAIISKHSDARGEGYFRREWKLAVERTHDMAEDVPFLLPVVIDETGDATARVPERFREVQWSHLPGGQTSLVFVEHVRRLLTPGALAPAHLQAATRAEPATRPAEQGAPARPTRTSPAPVIALAVLLAGAAAYFAVDRLWTSKHTDRAAAASGAVQNDAGAFSPPPHSIAVLPFVNMSGDKEQEYFSDGLTEELLNSLSEIGELQVAARTSAFSFKGSNTDIGTIARKLNVGAVLEGSVRRSGNTVRVTTQLINAVTGFHLWSHTYDRDLTNVLKLQTEIADAVAGALKVSMLGDVATKIELGGTRSPAALDAYLRGSQAFLSYEKAADLQVAIAAYSEAIQHDPGYALAFASRSVALTSYARNYGPASDLKDSQGKAFADAGRAIELAPELAEAHFALANILRDELEFTHADVEYRRAVALGPGNARLLAEYGAFATEIGNTESGLGALRRAVVLDPLSPEVGSSLGWALMPARQYREAIDVLTAAKRRAPNSAFINAWLAFAYYALGDYPKAQEACESADVSNRDICFALTYERLGRHADARRALSQLQTRSADSDAVFCSMILAQWGDKGRALDWLETALRQRDPYLIKVRANPFFDPLRTESRFQTIERALRFPAPE